MTGVLYYSTLCPRSLWLAGIVRSFDDRIEFEEREFGVRVREDGVVYGDLPILRIDGRLVEDPRAILRYLDERGAPSSAVRLLPSRPRASMELFKLLETLDEEILPPLALPLLLEEAGGRDAYLRSVRLSRRGRIYELWRMKWSYPRLLRLGLEKVGRSMESAFSTSLDALTTLAETGTLEDRIINAAVGGVLDRVAALEQWGPKLLEVPSLTEASTHSRGSRQEFVERKIEEAKSSRIHSASEDEQSTRDPSSP